MFTSRNVEHCWRVGVTQLGICQRCSVCITCRQCTAFVKQNRSTCCSYMRWKWRPPVASRRCQFPNIFYSTASKNSTSLKLCMYLPPCLHMSIHYLHFWIAPLFTALLPCALRGECGDQLFLNPLSPKVKKLIFTFSLPSCDLRRIEQYYYRSLTVCSSFLKWQRCY